MQYFKEYVYLQLIDHKLTPLFNTVDYRLGKETQTNPKDINIL